MPRSHRVCAACQSPIKPGQPMAEVRWGSLEEAGDDGGVGFGEDPTSERDVLCFGCADEATSLHSRMREGRL